MGTNDDEEGMAARPGRRQAGFERTLDFSPVRVDHLPDVGQVGEPLEVGGDGPKRHEEPAEQQDGDCRHRAQKHRNLQTSQSQVNINDISWGE